MTISDSAVGDLETLRAVVAGGVFMLGEAGYDEARRVWNLAVDERPAVVVEAESAGDVEQALRFARARGMRIAAQGTGHGAGPLESLEGAMLVRTSRMRSVRIDPISRTARAEAGAVWRDVTVPAAAYGLAALEGTAPDVGVTGYILGGGIGWLSRRYGLAANSVTAVELVTAEGRFVRADADDEPDLFWALRGGGGGVGVVTALEMRLYPVRDLYAGALLLPIQRAAQVLRAWRAWTHTVPDEVTSLGRILRLPPLLEIPEPLRGRAFAVVEAACLVDADTGRELLAPLRRLGPELDSFAITAPPALARLHMDPDQPTPNHGDGALLADLPDAAIDALLALAGPDADSPLLSIEIRHLGGALARPAPGGGAQPDLAAGYAVFAVGVTPTPEHADAVRAHTKALTDALTPWHAPHHFYNFTETPAPASAVLPAASHHRLQHVTAHYDPHHAIITTHPVTPPQ
ncbi:MAG TPA: FAD-binding oxidoreductase [Jatrophihabitantaceae bacterium]|nr:FAD-binding oxidoreductase [Jatrophihabitantaceae bacterium]